VDLVVSPNLVGFNTQSNGNGQILTPGQLIDALVLQLIDATTVRLSVAGTIVDVKTQVPLEPGSAVRLAVRGHGNETKLVIVGQGGAQGGAAQANAPRAAAALAASTSVTIIAPSANTSATAPATVPAQQPATQIAASITDHAAGTSTPLAHTSDAPVLAPNAPQTPAAILRAADPTVALANATRLAAARQTGLAPVFAEAAEAVQAPGVPPAVRQAAAQLLALRAPFYSVDEDGIVRISAATVQKAVTSAGLFLEARLDAQATGQATPAATATATSADIKAVLFTLRDALKAWLDPQSPLQSVVQGALQELTEPTANAGPAASVKPDEMIALAKSLAAEAKVPPPPYRNAPTQGQQPTPAAVPSDAPAKLLGHALLEETSGAIARTTLMQAASLPGAPSAVAEHADAGGKHWNLEVPFAMPQGTAIAHFEISRDDHKAAAAQRKPPGWRVNFSLDVEPMGPVHAQVSLAGHRAAVRLWAERPPTASALRGSLSELNAGFKLAGIDPAEVVVRDGAPPRPLKPGAGRFVDRAS
jgi:hypothetical protein